MNKILLLCLLSIVFHQCTPQPEVKPTIESIETPRQVTHEDQRRHWQKPKFVLDILGNLEGKVIADIGAGIGYFTLKLLPHAEKVIAIDIDPIKIEVLQDLKNSMDEKMQNAFDIRTATDQGPSLQENEVDLILIVNTITYLQPRIEYLNNLSKYLKPGGKVCIVDFKMKKLPDSIDAPSTKNRTYLDVIESHIDASELMHISTDDTSLEYQYIVLAKNSKS